MTLLAQYRTVSTIEAIISKIWYQKADTPNLQNGLANELFHYYFPPAAGWVVLPRRSSSADLSSGLVLRVGKWAVNAAPNPAFRNRVMVFVRENGENHTHRSETKEEPMKEELMNEMKEELNRLQGSGIIRSSKYWIALFSRRHVWFFHCERMPSGELVMRRVGPPMQPDCHKFDIPDDCLAVEDMLRYMSDRVRICSPLKPSNSDSGDYFTSLTEEEVQVK